MLQRIGFTEQKKNVDRFDNKHSRKNKQIIMEIVISPYLTG